MLCVIAALTGLLTRQLRRRAASTTSKGDWARRAALALCLLVPAGFLAALKTGIIPSTPINFALVVIAIVYFGFIQSYRIDRDHVARKSRSG